MPCRSLASARSLLPPRHRSPRHRLPDAIASVPSAACFVVISAAHRVDTATTSSSRFGSCPHPCQSLASESIAYRPPACFVIISAVHHACGSCPSPPLAPPLLSNDGEGIRAGCGLFRCRRLACFPNAVATPRAIWSAPISPRHLVRSCCFACADGWCVRCREVASTASPLERFNRFLKCCRINLLKLYGSSAWLCSTDTGGVSNPVASSFHPPFRLGVVGLIACVLCVAARPAPRAVIRLPLLAPLPARSIR